MNMETKITTRESHSSSAVCNCLPKLCIGNQCLIVAEGRPAQAKSIGSSVHRCIRTDAVSGVRSDPSSLESWKQIVNRCKTWCGNAARCITEHI